MFYVHCVKLLSNIYARILLIILNNMWLIFLCNIAIFDHWSGQMHIQTLLYLTDRNLFNFSIPILHKKIRRLTYVLYPGCWNKECRLFLDLLQQGHSTRY